MCPRAVSEQKGAGPSRWCCVPSGKLRAPEAGTPPRLLSDCSSAATMRRQVRLGIRKDSVLVRAAQRCELPTTGTLSVTMVTRENNRFADRALTAPAECMPHAAHGPLHFQGNPLPQVLASSPFYRRINRGLQKGRQLPQAAQRGVGWGQDWNPSPEFFPIVFQSPFWKGRRARRWEGPRATCHGGGLYKHP